MKLIKSFKALRPSKGKENDVIAPPYDVLNSSEAREMAKNKPFSFLHVSKPEIDLDPEIEFNNPYNVLSIAVSSLSLIFYLGI